MMCNESLGRSHGRRCARYDRECARRAATGETPAAGECRPEHVSGNVLVSIGALLLGLLLAALDQTIVSTALRRSSAISAARTPVMGRHRVSARVDRRDPLWGKLGDQYGRKRLFQIAIVIF